MGALSKPNWAPQAIATPRGWVDPRTGELLVGVRNLTSRMKSGDTMDTVSINERDTELHSEVQASELPSQASDEEVPPVSEDEIVPSSDQTTEEPEVINKTPAKKKGYTRKSS